jgi:hypothetical protein
MTIKEEVRSKKYIKKVGIGVLKPSELQNIFIRTAKRLLKDTTKAKCLLYPIKPRELEVRQVLCDVLTKLKYNHMIECPLDTPIKKWDRDSPAFVDLSIYTKKGIIDIEFKESPTDIGRDFPKLLSSSSVGCGSFYLFRGQNINRRLKLIMKRYQKSYESKYRQLKRKGLIHDKWFQFFLLAYDESRIFSKLYPSIKSIDFRLVFEGET